MRETPSPAALGFGAMLTASGPVILTASGIGRQSLDWFCSVRSPGPYPPEGPYALEHVPGELLFWGVFLLPVAVAGLLLRGSPRIAAATVGAVLAFGLVTALFLPAPDPCTGQEGTATLPWPLIFCYPVAIGALLLAARSPLPRRPYGIILWTAAVGAAAWTALFHRHEITYDTPGLSFVYMRLPLSFWDDLAWWSGEADLIGLPVTLVALAAASQVTPRWGRPAGTAAATALLLFPLLDVATCLSVGELPSLDSVRWPLLAASALVASATRVRVPGAGIINLISERSKGVTPGRTRNLAVAIVIATAGIWLIISSFTPTR